MPSDFQTLSSDWPWSQSSASALRLPLPARWPEFLARPLVAGAETWLGLPAFSKLYQQVRSLPHEQSFYDRLLQAMQVDYHLERGSLEAIPSEGPLIVVANHPCGPLEGVVLASLLRRVRPDLKMMTNDMLRFIPETAEMCIYVRNAFGRQDSLAINFRGLRNCWRWVARGGMLGIFPAGEVAYWRWQSRQVEESAWHPHIGRLIQRLKPNVLPVHFDGSNSPLFHGLGLIHSDLRTTWLIREMLKHRRRTVKVRLGEVISPATLSEWGNAPQILEILRQQTLGLGH